MVLAIMLGFLAYVDPDWGVPGIEGWDTPSAIQFWELIALLVIAPLMHRLDERQQAYGFLYYFLKDSRTVFEVEEGALRGLLTVQSIRSALTLGVLLALLSERDDLLGQVAITPGNALVTPGVMFFALAVAGLSGSALTTLAAIQSYDYALRFKWAEEKKNVKLEFVKKAHRLGVIGFYCLMWSLTTASALAGPLVGLAATSAVFLVMWYYYYFPVVTLRTRAELAVENLPPTARDTPVSASSIITSSGEEQREVVSLAEQWGAVRAGLVVVEKLLPDWAKSDVKTTIEIGERIVDPKS